MTVLTSSPQIFREGNIRLPVFKQGVIIYQKAVVCPGKANRSVVLRDNVFISDCIMLSVPLTTSALALFSRKSVDRAAINSLMSLYSVCFLDVFAIIRAIGEHLDHLVLFSCVLLVDVL